MVAENIKSLQQRIELKCSGVNRKSSEIKLIAVSKTFGVEAIEEVYNEGLRDFAPRRYNSGHFKDQPSEGSRRQESVARKHAAVGP